MGLTLACPKFLELQNVQSKMVGKSCANVGVLAIDKLETTAGEFHQFAQQIKATAPTHGAASENRVPPKIGTLVDHVFFWFPMGIAVLGYNMV